VTDAELATRIHAYLRAAAAARRATERVGPFVATFDEASSNPFLNYAIPDDGATPSADDVRQLVAVFTARHRAARLEYLPVASPGVEPMLLAAGFVAEGRPMLMTCARGQQCAVPDAPGIVFEVATDVGAHRRSVEATHEAFGETAPVTASDVERMQTLTRAGGCVMLARDVASGDTVAGGAFTAPMHGVTEVAGIGVRAGFRRRGIAAGLTARLTAEAFQRAVTLAFLSAGHDEGERVYARAGYTSRLRMLHISR
jgi:ribosomal protein S18 acetylase RimI-like enzyme